MVGVKTIKSVNHIEVKVIEVLRKHANSPPHEMALDIPLFEGGLELDSISIFEALIELESEIGYKLISEELDERTLATIGTLIEHLKS